MEPEDVAILGAMTVLLFRKLSTNQGTNGRILILGVASLKHFKLNLFFCVEPGLSLKHGVCQSWSTSSWKFLW
jgi:hypothetical protein